MPTTRLAARALNSNASNEASSSASANLQPGNPRNRQDNNHNDEEDEPTQFLTNDPTWATEKLKIAKAGPDEPPTFTINLSAPPRTRYNEVCAALRPEIANLTSLFDEVVGSMLPFVPLRLLHFLCGLVLRGLHGKEETDELRGISEATGVKLYLLVAFNVLLDLFMGCSSGGAAVRDEVPYEGEGTGTGWKMVHFRTLDWGMDKLRRVVVRLDFVTEDGGEVVASVVTYAGFVGVLTGVRQGLSVSLNFRPTRKNKGVWRSDFRYWGHLGLVLTGWRPSIASLLRGFLLPVKKEGRWEAMEYREVVGKVFGYDSKRRRLNDQPLVSTACYLCLSDGDETTIFEKDLRSSVVRSDCDFIVITNNDVEDSPDPETSTNLPEQSPFLGALAEIVDEAKDRKECAEHNWSKMQRARARQHQVTVDELSQAERRALLDVDDVIESVQRFPTTNETTHYACVMDPRLGTVRWCRRWQRSVGAKWIREHQ